ncbi:MAG: hypothetical protein DSZ06_04690 [Sulfurospirillum sp.]|nr:MAG: hypothetical protein DSZ06_04690 [Sulfurospirillum sp.]
MSLKLLSNVFLSLTLLLLSGCGEGELTDSIKTNHYLTQSVSSPLKINEILSANANTNYDPDFKGFSDWIEIYNDSNKTINIEGYFLSDSKKNIQKWKFPQGSVINPYGYLLVWADGKNKNLQALHTNFKLSVSGESVLLSDPRGVIVDWIEYSNQDADISCTKKDGKIVYMNPSPKAKNHKTYDLARRTMTPTFSLKGGVYDETQILELESNQNSKIYYTLDGTTPTINSTQYENPITIDKTTVVRAIALQENKFASRPKTYTYLIDENITLPVVSLSIDEKYLNDSEIGIYKNFNEDWMRAGNVEYIKDGVSQFSENIGVRIYGSYSRTFPLKSLAIFAKNKYGLQCINYKLFPDKPHITKIKSFILRNSGNDWNHANMRDGLTNALAQEIGNLDYQSYHPAIVYINGKYHGIQNIREKINEDFLKANHSIQNSIDLIEMKQEHLNYLKGKNNEFNQLISFIENHSMLDKYNYIYVKSQIDIDEFINYSAIQIFIGNVDWPRNNVKFWKEQPSISKWRWILYDTDFGFGLPHHSGNYHVDFNKFNELYSEENTLASIIYRKLLENPTFKNKFTSKFMTLLNTVFTPENINKHIDELKQTIEPEVPRHTKKWSLSMQNWYDEINKIYDYSNRRNEIIRDQLREEFNLNGIVHLKIPKPECGTVYIDGIKLDQNFDGSYFIGVKVNLDIETDFGCKFLGWSNGIVNKSIILEIDESQKIEPLCECKG